MRGIDEEAFPEGLKKVRMDPEVARCGQSSNEEYFCFRSGHVQLVCEVPIKSLQVEQGHDHVARVIFLPPEVNENLEDIATEASTSQELLRVSRVDTPSHVLEVISVKGRRFKRGREPQLENLISVGGLNMRALSGVGEEVQRGHMTTINAWLDAFCYGQRRLAPSTTTSNRAMNNDNDFVADSEEEPNMDDDVGEVNRKNDEPSTGLLDICKGGQTPPAHEYISLRNASSIGQFTIELNDGDVSTSISAFTTPSVKQPRPKPRPRPRYKKPGEDVPVLPSTISSFSPLHLSNAAASMAVDPTPSNTGLSDLPAISSIADRAKMRQRKATGLSSIQQWDDADFDSTTLKETKSVDRLKETFDTDPSATKGKGKSKVSSNIIELTDGSGDEDELMLKQKRPVTKSKAPPTNLNQSPDSNDNIPRPKPRPRPRKAPNPSSSHQPPDTGFKPSPPNRTAFRAPHIPSSLPPSDPPFPTPQTPVHDSDLPQIEVLQEAQSDPHDGPNEVDELFSGDEDVFGLKGFTRPLSAEPKVMLPPPTFFAGSSSQVHEEDRHSNMVDLTLLPTVPLSYIGVAAIDGLPEIEKITPPLAKAKRKKKVVIHEDDDDADWDGAPSKVKEKKASSKKKKATKGHGPVEVVISTRPPIDSVDGNKAKKKKGKGEVNGKKRTEEAKGVYKSKETIEDSDEDPLLGSYRPGDTSATLIPSTENLSSRNDTSFQEADVQPGDLEPLSPLPDGMDDDAPVVGRKDARKKRKSTVVQEDEEFDEIPQEDSPTKRRKMSSKEKNRKGKGREVEMNVADATAPSEKQKGKKKATLVLSDEDAADVDATSEPVPRALSKENAPPQEVIAQTPKQRPLNTSTPIPLSERPPLHSRYSIVSRAKATPMTELIKRVNSFPSSPFPLASSRLPTIARTATAYSPYLKSSRSLLSKIAPLHPNRRTPPPPLPPPPPKKKTKKELEREERWEEEMIDSVGGIEAWAAMSNIERKDMRQAKMELEMGGWE